MPTWTKEQQSAIEESGTNIIVSAGAGSGKTAVLSERVINKLNNGVHIDELLILTFTRAAAEEMKDRIRKKIASKPEFKDELDRLSSAYITTFDSFALSVLKKYHYLLNLPSDIQVAEETIVSLKKIEIIDEVFDYLYEQSDSSFTDFIKRYSLKNDKSVKETILSLADKIENFIDRDEYLEFLEMTLFSDEYITELIAEFKTLIAKKQKNLSLELKRAYLYFDEDYNKKLDEVLLPIINCDSIIKLISYKGVKLPPLKRGTDDEAKIVKDQIKDALTELLNLLEFGDEDKIREDILSTKKTTLEIVRILKMYFTKLDEFKETNNLYTFTDIALLSIRVLKENKTAREELKNKFKEIMIDEYQDTNDVQETFISLIADNNVYMVGDIKQSIYRFRGSNPNIFKDKYDHYSINEGGKKIDLIKNFRSRSEVLDNINKIFDLLMDDYLGGAKYTESHEMVYGNTLYDENRVEGYDYNFEVLEYDSPKELGFTNAEVEIFMIAKDIQEKMKSHFQVFDKNTGSTRPFKYSDAVIILDRSKYFDLYKQIFEYLGIPLTILKDDKLSSSTDLIILKNLLELITRIHKKDFKHEFRYAFLSIGRSHLYEYDDEYLFDILKSEDYKSTTLYQDLISITDYNSKTTSEIIKDILDKTKFFEKISKIGDYQNTELRINKILDFASSLDTTYSIEEFKDYLSSIIETGLEIKYTSFNGDTDSVKILTIHKSKGLEYPVCYFADLDHSFNTKELKDKMIADHKYGLITAVEMENDEDTDSILKVLYKSSFMSEEIGEKIRLFYVALTRAREKMIIVIPKKDTHKLEKNDIGTIEEARRLKFKSLGDFIYGTKDYLEKYFHTCDLNSLNLTKDYLYTKKASKTIDNIEVENFEVKELNIEIKNLEEKSFSKITTNLLDKDAKKNMELGLKMHEALEYADFKNFSSDSIDDSFIKNNINKFLQNPLFSNIEDAKIYKEFEFVYEDTDTVYHGIIDLMLEYDNYIDIVDYKLKSVVDENYKHQLAGYKNYISKITNKKINTYLYSILDGVITKIDGNI